MQLSNDTAGPAQIITGYGPAELRIGERVITSSSIITADRVLPWPVVSIADLTPALLEPALALGVEVLLLSTGPRQLWPDPALFAHAASRRVGLEVMEVGAACRTFNVLVRDGRPVALAALLGPAV